MHTTQCFYTPFRKLALGHARQPQGS